MPRVDDEPSVIYRYFVERTGVVREPIAGRVDFVHRTFQEYLAAKEAVDQGHIGLLVEKAHLDQWREVVILAAGHATGGRASVLMNGLLDRGYAEADHRHRLHLLAVACLETAVDYTTDTKARLEACLNELLPPRNFTEAEAVASAGELAVARLGQLHHSKASSAAACVRALATIGGPRALNALSFFGPDKRVTVSRELIRAWRNFDPDEFAERVLAESPLEGGTVRITDKDFLASLRKLKHLRIADVSLGRLDSFQPVSNVANLIGSLNLWSCEVSELDLSSVSHLVHLGLRRSPRLKRVTGFQALEYLHSAVIEGVSVTSQTIAEIASSPSLSHLDLRSVPQVADITPLYSLRGASLRLDVRFRTSEVLSSPLVESNEVAWWVTVRNDDFYVSPRSRYSPESLGFEPITTLTEVHTEYIEADEPFEDETGTISEPPGRMVYRFLTLFLVPEVHIERFLQQIRYDQL
jgi:hypothetical protein